MYILTIRTDKPEAELAVFDDKTPLARYAWEAHHALAETLSTAIQETLSKAGITIEQLGGIVVFQGPGSFTGLRIGISVANAMADGLKLPIIGSQGEDWTNDGLGRLLSGDTDKIVLPQYGSEPHITLPKK